MVAFQGKLRDEAHAKGERLRARRGHPTGFGMPRGYVASAARVSGLRRPSSQLALTSQLGVLDHWAGVHHDVETCVECALGAVLVDHPELEPDGFDAQPFLVGDRLIDYH